MLCAVQQVHQVYFSTLSLHNLCLFVISMHIKRKSRRAIQRHSKQVNLRASVGYAPWTPTGALPQNPTRTLRRIPRPHLFGLFPCCIKFDFSFFTSINFLDRHSFRYDGQAQNSSKCPGSMYKLCIQHYLYKKYIKSIVFTVSRLDQDHVLI